MRGITRVLTSVAAAAALVAGGLSGCAGSADDDTGGRGSSAATGSATASTTASGPVASSSAAPAGTMCASAERSGLRFAVPDDWTLVDASAISKDPDSDLVKGLVKTFGMSAEQLAQVLGQMDLVVVGPQEKSFTPNVNVVLNQLTELPEASELATELTKLGAKTGAPRDASTALGPAIVVPYELENGAKTVQGRSIVVEGPQGFVTVTVSHVTDSGADAVAATILSTIAPTP